MRNINLIFVSILLLISCSKTKNIGPEASTGKGGSTARFTIIGDYLYIVDNQSLNVYNIGSPANPIFSKKVPINTVVETIFPFNNHLLIGTQTGMYVFSITDPTSPALLSTFQHLRSCDPVVAEGDLAFLTLRSGTICNRGVNQLDILEIKDLKAPKLLKSYPMQSPHGLGVDGKLLFITEGDNGLKMYDRTDPMNIVLLKYFETVKANDVITDDNVLIITGNDGIYQYDYNDPKNLILLSSILYEK